MNELNEKGEGQGYESSSMKLTKPHMVQVGGERRAKKLRMLRMFWNLKAAGLPPFTDQGSDTCVCVSVWGGCVRAYVCVCMKQARNL